MKSLVAIACGVTLLAMPAASFAWSPEPDLYYKLSTRFRGTGMPMDVYNGGPQDNQTHLDIDQNVSGQNWRFVPAGNGSYRLMTEFRGPDMCLDINPPTNRPELRTCGNYSGQFWRVVDDGAWVRLTTEFRGPGMCLDIDPTTNQPELRDCGNFTGQYWAITPSN